jgi:hypothetical protein
VHHADIRSPPDVAGRDRTMEATMNLFPKNEGALDRGVRIVIGLGLLATVFVGPQSLWGLIGLVPLATGLIGSCPAYTLLGIRTCPLPAAKSA